MTFSVTSGTTGDGRTPPPGTRVECGTLAEGTFMTSRTNRFTHPIVRATAIAAVCCPGRRCMLKLQEDLGACELRSQHPRSQRRCCNLIRKQRAHDRGKRACVVAG